ncbi:MAG: ABC transporter ATP-binding protein [Sphaerochaetaceae bacterium]
MSIEVRNLRFGYKKDEEILHDIDFAAADGEITTIIGPNGVGKTTLFRCILGLVTPHSGTVLVNGQDTCLWSHKKFSCQVAYVPQAFYPTFNYKCLEMVLMGANNRIGAFGTPGSREVAQATEYMKRLGIEYLSDRLFLEVSGGERQLVLIVRALMQNATTLLLDEPSANLDFGNQARVMKQISLLAESGYCIVQTTHNPDQAFLYSQKIAAFKEGTLFQQGKPQELINADLIKTLYGIDTQVESLLGDRIRVCVPLEILKRGEEKE